MPAASTPAVPLPIAVLMPLYDDSEAATAVVQATDRAFARIHGAQLSIVSVDGHSVALILGRSVVCIWRARA